jgi:hypothetical protein
MYHLSWIRKIKINKDSNAGIYTSPSYPESNATFSTESLPSRPGFNLTCHIVIPLRVATAINSYALCRNNKTSLVFSKTDRTGILVLLTKQESRAVTALSKLVQSPRIEIFHSLHLPHFFADLHSR